MTSARGKFIIGGMGTSRIHARGTVKWYDARKGFGFAERKGAPPVFLHYGAIKSDGVSELKAGQVIEFILDPTSRGAVAHGIRLVQG